MTEKAMATLLELLVEIVETEGVFSYSKANLVKKLIKECAK